MRIEIDGNRDVRIIDESIDFNETVNLTPSMIAKLQEANLDPARLAQALASARAMDANSTVFSRLNNLLANIRNGVILHELE
nr:MAG TPA: hypothetical protein [Caudoviricetes sp.]